MRTLIGVVVGATVGFGFWAIPYFSRRETIGNSLFFSFLVPVRIGEWWLLLSWVYSRFTLRRSTRAGLITGGILTSFVLDGLGLLLHGYYLAACC